MEINVTAEFDSTQIENLVSDTIASTLESMSTDEIVDLDEVAQEVMSLLDKRELAEYVEDYIDLDDKIDDYLRSYDYVLGSDIEGCAESLLDQYDPQRQCSTGKSFTRALNEWFLFAVENNSDVQEAIANAANKDKTETVQAEEQIVEPKPYFDSSDIDFIIRGYLVEMMGKFHEQGSYTTFYEFIKHHVSLHDKAIENACNAYNNARTVGIALSSSVYNFFY